MFHFQQEWHQDISILKVVQVRWFKQYALPGHERSSNIQQKKTALKITEDCTTIKR
jgi:hypothetical protein